VVPGERRMPGVSGKHRTQEWGALGVHHYEAANASANAAAGRGTGGMQLRETNAMKGVIISPSMKWSERVAEVASKASELQLHFTQLRFEKRRPLHGSLYVLRYASPVRRPGLEKHQKELQRVINEFIRRVGLDPSWCVFSLKGIFQR